MVIGNVCSITLKKKMRLNIIPDYKHSQGIVNYIHGLKNTF